MNRPLHLFAGLISLSISMGGCYTGVTLEQDSDDTNPGPGLDSDGSGSQGDGSSGDGQGDGDTDPAASECEGVELTAGASALRRLTAREYANTVGDLFGELEFGDLGLVDESAERYYSNNVLEQPVTPLHIERFVAAAQTIAEQASTTLSWAPCDPMTQGDSCVDELTSWLAERAYRRPLSAEEEQALTAFARGASSQYGTRDGIRMVVEAVLESPYFLYRPEVGPSDSGVSTPLSDYELASRLSYFLWETMPDDALMQAAAEGTLAEEQGLRAQAERMLADPRAKAAISRFHTEYFHLERLSDLNLNTDAFPELDAAMREDLALSTRMFLDDVFWNGDYEEFMQGTFGYANDRLAPLFGIDPPQSEALVRVPLPEGQRAGALTQPGLLASSSLSLRHSPTLRGVFVLDRIFCSEPQPPPDNVEGQTDDDAASEGQTVREKIEESHADESCQACHHQIDGIGFSFEHYDALGRYREREAGQQVDPSGVLWGTDVDGEVADALALADRIADSRQARTCAVRQWYEFAQGRSVVEADSCQLEALSRTFESNGGDVQSLLLELVSSPSFRMKFRGEE